MESVGLGMSENSALASEALNGPAGTGQHVDGNRNTFFLVFHSVPKFPESWGVPSMIMAAWGTGTRGEGRGGRGGRPGHRQDGDDGDGGQDQDLRPLRTWYHDPWCCAIHGLQTCTAVESSEAPHQLVLLSRQIVWSLHAH